MNVPRPARPSEFYQRKRRLAIVFAGLSVALLVASAAIGFTIERGDRPRVAVDGDRLRFVWSIESSDLDDPGTRILETDLDLKPQGPGSRFGGDATAVLPAEDSTLLFFGPSYSVIKGGSSVLRVTLEQPWAVQAAVRDPQRRAGWIFGHHQGKVVARRRELGTFSEPLIVAESPGVDRIAACVDGAAGPLVAWRERGSGTVKLALFDGHAFAPRGEFKLGAASQWDVALAGPRVLLATYERADRSFSSVGLRLRCCEGCPSPREPSLLRFPDPALFLGKAVTGLAVAAAGDGLAVLLTRWTVVQAATAPLEGPGRPLALLHQEAAWRTAGGVLIPFTTLFFSFSLVFLGFALLRERNQFILEKLTPPATEGPVPAAILQRAMAYILDLLVLLPLFMMLALTLDLSPDLEPDPSDPAFWILGGTGAALQVLYGLLMEGTLGWTLGKRIIGLRVVRLDGSRLTPGRALLRNLTRPLDAGFPLGVFVGMSLLMTTRRRQRLGDLLARTMVIEDRPAPPHSPRP